MKTIKFDDEEIKLLSHILYHHLILLGPFNYQMQLLNDGDGLFTDSDICYSIFNKVYYAREDLKNETRNRKNDKRL